MKIPMLTNLKRLLSFAVIITLITLAMFFVHNFLKNYSVHQILQDLNNITIGKKLSAVGLTVASYLFLTVYDFLGLKYLGKKLAAHNVIFTSFVSYAFSNSIGLSILASGSLRYRYYSSWGLSFNEITKIILFTTATLWVGILTVGGLAFTFEPAVTLPVPLLSHINMHYIGALFLLAVSAYLSILYFFKNPIPLYSLSINLPSLRMGVLQVLAGGADWILAGAVLYVLLPEQVHMSFFAFMGIYLMAQTLGLISHVPGGLLVFESVLLSFFPSEYMTSMIGSILVYRATYYILPLLVAAFMIGASESYRHIKKLENYLTFFNRIYIFVIPNLIFVIVFICGVYMFLTGATPINPERFSFVKEVFPLAIVESSHFIESLIGIGLIILSRGLKKRVDLAYQLTVILLIAGTVFGILKGAEVETAIFTVGVIISMLPARKLFNRKSPFFTEIMSKEWLFSVFIIILIFAWLGFFSYKHVEYKNSLWFTFTFTGEAPRFLRALVGSLTLLLGLTLYRFMLPSRKMPVTHTDSKELIHKIADQSAQTYANLAYLPDKSYLFSEAEDAFIMYGTAGRSFISMGDPVSGDIPAESVSELIREFRKISSQHGCSSVFYEISAKYIPYYIDAGFRIFKIGEEARVKLETFNLSGGHWSGTRNLLKKMEKEECRVEILESVEAERLMPALKIISDQWLDNKNTREKKFSLGCFDEEYLKKTKIAVVFRGETPVAFANMWLSGVKQEISVDLMRYGADAPSGVMEYLFIKLILFGQDNGYDYFSLGMAPLSGMEIHSFSPFWNRIASTAFNHGERFYNFKGLRSYKEKFKPEWEPKYIAVPSIFSLPKALTNIASLISGGTSGIFKK